MTDAPPPDPRESVFRQLYAELYPEVLRFVARRCHPSHAEDVTSEIFVVAWRRYEQLPADSGERRAWLFGVGYKLLANTRRGDQRREALVVRMAETVALVDPGTHPDLVATRVDLVRAWGRLRAIHQEALALSLWDGLSAAEAAHVLGISATAYRLRLSRARRALRADMSSTARARALAGDPALQGEFR